MKLKRVKIVGFKTFADRTEFEIDGDVIAVVGPNGCGKSNIVDAILWGLGESNSRNLRAQTSQEVIFSGSLRRKPQSYAEVTLVFDNEDGTLPLDAPEVAITRKLNRAGDSEYAINRRACRLRDVTELLADSGLGRAGYAIVGQSDIDQALAASPVQRRAWIDEAAGVQRYRMRRAEALRKLEQCADHLARVNDIVQEIEQQREPLRNEAEVARRYKATLASLREIEVGLLAHEIAETGREAESQAAQVESVAKLIDDQSAEVETLEAEAVVLNQRVARLDAEAEALRDAQLKTQAALEAAKTTLEVAQTKLESLDQLERNLHEEGARAGERLQEIENDLNRAREEAVTEAAALESLRESLGGAGEEAKTLGRLLKELESELAKARAAMEARHRATLERAHRQDRLDQIGAELDGIAATLPELTEGVQEAERQVAEVDEKIAEADAQVRGIDERVQAGKQRDHAAQQETRSLLSQLAMLEGKRRAIESTIASHEGLAQGPRAVLGLVQSGRLPNVYLPVSDALEADTELALAIDTALGASANDLIVPDDRAAKDAIELLKRDRLGRATFQPVNLMRPPGRSRELDSVLRERGVVGLASELVVCDPADRPVIDSLLGRVVVVEDLDSGLRLARTSGWSRMVTLDGETVFASGAVSGGVQARQSVGTVQRRAELADLAMEAEELQVRVATLAKDTEKVEAEKTQLEAQRQEIRSRRAELKAEREDLAAWLAGLKHELATTQKSRERLEHEREKLIADLPELGEAPDTEAIEARRDETVKALAAKSADAERAQEAIREAESRAAIAKQRRGELEKRFQAAQEAEQHRQKRQGHLEPERERLRSTILESRQHGDTLAVDLVQARQHLTQVLAQRTEAQDQVRAGEEKIRACQKASHGLSETLHKAELARARAETKRTNAVERLLVEYGLRPEEVEATEVPADAPSLVNRLRKELKEMGDVNLGSIDAYDRLNARYEELTGQADDILRGKTDVEGSIRELDRLTRDRFVSTFEAVQQAFAQSFRQIFGDGEGVLELEEADNVLDSGVDISVQVPGKKRQRLELLSGGERALAAMAFLFALIKVKPTPLVVLDEIDAPLDGRNVERFIGIMRTLAESVQFILITHNPVTIESADVWFGVTMQEPGVSTLVPVKAPDKQVVRAVVPDAFLKG